MGANSAISWTDHTFNPWWGCTKVSQGCKNCYADREATRFGHEVFGPTAQRRFFGDKYWEAPLKWQCDAAKEGVRRRVFCASMSDVFESYNTCRYDDAQQMKLSRARLWELIKETPNLDWLVLTKRPENVMVMVPAAWYSEVGSSFPANFWIGTSCEDQATANERIAYLLKIPAKVRFLSCEPLIAPLVLAGGYEGGDHSDFDFLTGGIHWVIVGGESGPAARPMNSEWARTLRDQCKASGVAFHFKQWGEYDESGLRSGRSHAGRIIDGREWNEYPDVSRAGNTVR